MAILPRQFKALMEMLKAELAFLRETIQKSATAVSDQHIAQNESEQYEREKIRHAIDSLTNQNNQAANTTEANQERRHGQNLGVQWVTAIATTLAFIAASIYAWIAHDQLTQMRIATEQAKRSADIASCALRENQRQFNKTLEQMTNQTTAQQGATRSAIKSTNIASNALHLEERPWIQIAVKVTGPLHFRQDGVFLPLEFSMTNIGHSPALGVVTWAQLVPGFAAPARKEIESYCKVIREPMKHPTETSNGIMLFPGQPPNNARFPVAMNKNELNKAIEHSAIQGKIGFFVIACADYGMSFDDTHHQTQMAYGVFSSDTLGYAHGAFDPSVEYITVYLAAEPAASAD